LALMLSPGLDAEILPFRFDSLSWFEDVLALGYAFGFEPPVYHLRAFQRARRHTPEPDDLAGRTRWLRGVLRATSRPLRCTSSDRWGRSATRGRRDDPSTSHSRVQRAANGPRSRP
jgi:hypothetical protein